MHGPFLLFFFSKFFEFIKGSWQYGLSPRLENFENKYYEMICYYSVHRTQRSGVYMEKGGLACWIAMHIVIDELASNYTVCTLEGTLVSTCIMFSNSDPNSPNFI